MAFCSNCGSKIVDGAKFCQKCGTPITDTGNRFQNQRQQEFEGKIYKCPNCGEILQSFVTKCPTCGLELRGLKATSAVREFALKLEAIESHREYKKKGLFSGRIDVNGTDEKKISLIKNFSVPNTKEDMLEFMILATSNVNTKLYDSTNTSGKTENEEAINEAWMSKVKQVYEKARLVYSNEEDFCQIQNLFKNCNSEVKKTKKKSMVKMFFMVGWLPIAFAIFFIWAGIYAPFDEKKEVARLDAIVEQIEEQLEEGKYKYALMNADGLVYGGMLGNAEQSRRWEIKREYWIDKVIEEAAEDGIVLERPEEKTEEESSNDESTTGGFVEGFKQGIQPGMDAAKANMDEFNRIINEGRNNSLSMNSNG